MIFSKFAKRLLILADAPGFVKKKVKKLALHAKEC